MRMEITLIIVVMMRLRFDKYVFLALLGSEGGDLDQITFAAICSERKRRGEMQKVHSQLKKMFFSELNSEGRK
eukprot:2188459-Ditylum_brightwellii.AAC.1